MTVEKLTLPSQVLELWNFFESGLMFLQAQARESYDSVQMQKLFCRLAAEPKAYVAVVYDESGTPVCFGVGQENTLPYSQNRTAEVKVVYHRPSFINATLYLAGAFENWCREREIKSYTMTTKRNTGAVIRCFRHARYGFKRPYLTFEKDII